MDDDVIGSEPERTPRRRSGVRGIRWPVRLQRYRSTVVVLVAVLAAVLAIVGLRAGVGGLRPEHGPGAPVAGAQVKPPLAGTVLELAAGQNTIYAVASDSAAGSRPMLLASTTDGGRWSTLDVPGIPSDPSAVTSWRLAVSGVEDLLAIEDADDRTVTVGSPDNPFVTKQITAGPPVVRVPAGREVMVRLCVPPQCTTPRLDYLDPRTALIGPLANQPPLQTRTVAVLGTQLWVAGIDPRTGKYAVATSVDDATTWALVPLPGVSTDPKLVARLAPVPELNTAWLLLGKPGRRGQFSSDAIWVVPAPTPGGEPPHRVRPESPFVAVAGAVGIKDGRLALIDNTQLAVLSPDGVVDRMLDSDGEDTRYVIRQPQRGPRLLLVALAVRTDGVAAIATSTSGDADEWTVRPIVL